jgi:hypothetical protein
MPRSSRGPDFRSLLGLAVALLLCACGQGAGSLNSQGERALRYGAFIDAQYFFRYAQERVERDLARGEVTPPHPEAARARAGALALLAWSDAPSFLPALRQTLRDDPTAFGPAQFLLLAEQALAARLAPEGRLILDLAAQRGQSSPGLDELRPEVEAAAAQALGAVPGWTPPDATAFLAGADFGRTSWPPRAPEFEPGADPEEFR